MAGIHYFIRRRVRIFNMVLSYMQRIVEMIQGDSCRTWEVANENSKLRLWAVLSEAWEPEGKIDWVGWDTACGIVI